MEIKNDNIQYAGDHSLDQGQYPDVFPLDFGNDFHLNEHPGWKFQIREPRKVKIEITSFIGTCWEAIHYYAKLIADGIDIIDDQDYCVGGYLGEEHKNLPRELKDKWSSSYDIEIARGVTEEEIKNDPHRWKFYHPGEKTNGFENKEELLEVARKVAEIRFPGWEIVVDDCTI